MVKEVIKRLIDEISIFYAVLEDMEKGEQKTMIKGKIIELEVLIEDFLSSEIE